MGGSLRWMNRRERDRSLGHRRLAQCPVGDGLTIQKSVVESARQRTHVIQSVAKSGGAEQITWNGVGSFDPPTSTDGIRFPGRSVLWAGSPEKE